MKKQISPKIVSLIFGILVVCFAVGFYVFAWTDPTNAPPGGNIPAPVNVGGTEQYKSGALGVGGLFQTDNETHLAILGGNVGIGTTSPIEELHVVGDIRATGNLYLGTSISFNSITNTITTSSNILSFGSTNLVTTGNVGIGDTSPDAGTGGQLKLDVEGPVGAKKYCDEYGNDCRTITEMSGSGGVTTGSYVGDGTYGKEITVGFRPRFIMIVNMTANYLGIFRIDTFTGTQSRAFYTNNWSDGGIIELTNDGFKVGTIPQVNTSGHTYHWVASGSGIYDQNCAWTAWGTCTCSGTPSISCPAGKVATGFGSQGCGDDVTRCDQQRLYCCGQ